MIIAASAAAIVFYGAALLIKWRLVSLRQQDLSEPAIALPASANAWMNLCSSAGLICQGLACYALLFSPDGFNLSLLVVCNLVSFIMTFVVVSAVLRLPVDNLILILHPLAILLLAAVLLIGPGETAFTDIDTYLATHILISLGAYAMLMMAAIQSGLLAAQEKNLRNRSFSVLRFLPPLESMERLLVFMLWVGLVLLTGAIVTGFVFLDVSQQVAHHFVLTTASWLTYVIFLAGRYFFGWRGLTAVRWTTTAFIFLLLGYLGSKFVLEYLLS